MNVLIINENNQQLANLEIELIKTKVGEFDVEEIISEYKELVFNKIIIDVTSINNYINVDNIKKLSTSFNSNNIILLVPDDYELLSSTFLTKIIDMGIYNITTNANEIIRLIDKPKTKEEALELVQVKETSQQVSERLIGDTKIIGIKNATEHAGATTLIYMLKKTIEKNTGEKVYAIEVDKSDLTFYYDDENLLTVTKENLASTIENIKEKCIILVDLNDYEDSGICGDVIYLVEPSQIKLNKLIRTHKDDFTHLGDKKIVLNMSFLDNKDIAEFEYEAKLKVAFNLPHLNERKDNEILVNFLQNIGLININKKVNENKGIFSFLKK